MENEIWRFLTLVAVSFGHAWPYLLLTVPLAAAVNLSGASRHIRRAFQAGPAASILLATAVGAFSPFCSCSVVPVVASLLLSGVPLAPVMSFWIASPSMDPEIFLLSVATIGWKLALWRLGGTLVLSLVAGAVTHVLVARGWVGEEILRRPGDRGWPGVRARVRALGEALRSWLVPAPASGLAMEGACCAAATTAVAGGSPVSSLPSPEPTCCGSTPRFEPARRGRALPVVNPLPAPEPAAGRPFGAQVLAEARSATLMVLKFMSIAFALEAAIKLYVPDAWIVAWLAGDRPWSVLLAAAVGVPVYTSNLTALPMVGALLARGMSPAAALAFLVAGPTTTIPAMAAVWGIASRRVFALYVAFAFVGALALGTAYQLFG